ncbi:MAG: hypothetical protein IBX69_05530, partial [Anaerolineales bacterium]|nr:hypothetical protein [Anaerolineales bacterium]
MRCFLIGRLPNKSLRVFLIFFTQLALLISSIGAVEKPEKIAQDAPIDHKEMLVLSATSPVSESAVSGGTQQTQANPAFYVYLPVVESSPAGSAPPGEDAHLAIERVNYYRTLAGVANLQIRETIIEAAENHANYYLLNFADPQAWEYGFHGEVSGKPGFSGKWPYDRMQAADYPWFGSAEVMHFLADPLVSVDEWMSGVLHRVILLEPTLTCAGYALGKNEHAAVDVLDLGIGADTQAYLASAAPYPLVYPADGQPG